MRNAALVTAARISREDALSWARELLSDRALVVRAAAVDTINELGDVSSLPLLWQKLNSKENFKGNQSLFIRRKIVETLAKMETPGREALFVQVLSDRDESLHAPAMAALERITEKNFGSPKDSLKVRRAQWQAWHRDQNSKIR
jgi:HEAT repeat protein